MDSGRLAFPRHLELAGIGSEGWAGAIIPQLSLRGWAMGGAELRDHRRLLMRWSDALEALAWMEAHARSQTGGRWIGFFGYDLGRLFEPSSLRRAGGWPFPDFAFGFGPIDDPSDADSAAGAFALGQAALTSTFDRPAYLAAVRRAMEYIAAGDIFQVNLSQRFTRGLPRQPLELFRQIQADAPALYAGHLDFGDFALVCNSPELFRRVAPDPAAGERVVLTRPIKGTRPRAPGMAEALLNSDKDAAELNMIVDLERNDLGRVCRIGSVQVTQHRAIEAHPTVYHGVAAVSGALRPQVRLVDLLRAVFPGGSITGAPKIRAMQIIDELEPVHRGPYCGAIGYLAADGVMEFNIAIRTMIVRDGLVHIPVGGGIVADSDPAAEYEETLVKAKAFFAALGQAPPT